MKIFIRIFGLALSIIISYSISGTSEAVTPASKDQGGHAAVPVAPNVAKTPSPGGPIPIPYPNIGKNLGASKRSKNMGVKKRAVTTKSKFSRSMGDEPGVQKGLIAPKHMDKVKYKAGSSKVKTDGKPIVLFSDKPIMNK